jgi:hypothetical protein
MSPKGLAPKTYTPLPMTPREMRELMLDCFQSDTDLMKGEVRHLHRASGRPRSAADKWIR